MYYVEEYNRDYKNRRKRIAYWTGSMVSNDITTRSFEARLPPSKDLSKQTNWPSYPRHPGRFLTGTRQSTFQPLLFNYSGISWKSSIASWGAFPARRVLRIRQLIDRQPGTGQRGMKPAGRVERGRGMAEGGGVASRATLWIHYISGSKGCWHMRRWGGSTLSSTGTRRASLSLFLSSTPPPPLVARSSSGHRTLLSVPALIIHALTNPPPTRQGSTRREGSTTLVLTRRSLGGAWTIPQSSCFA